MTASIFSDPGATPAIHQLNITRRFLTQAAIESDAVYTDLTNSIDLVGGFASGRGFFVAGTTTSKLNVSSISVPPQTGVGRDIWILSDSITPLVIEEVNTERRDIGAKQIGTVVDDTLNSVSLAADGSILLTGGSRGIWTVNTDPNLGFMDAYVAKLDSACANLANVCVVNRVIQFGSAGSDTATAAFTNDKGYLFVAGTTQLNPFILNGSILSTDSQTFLVKFGADSSVQHWIYASPVDPFNANGPQSVVALVRGPLVGPLEARRGQTFMVGNRLIPISVVPTVGAAYRSFLDEFEVQ